MGFPSLEGVEAFWGESRKRRRRPVQWPPDRKPCSAVGSLRTSGKRGDTHSLPVERVIHKKSSNSAVRDRSIPRLLDLIAYTRLGIGAVVFSLNVG